MANDELYHWGLKLGAESKNHKYYQRINTGTQTKPKYRYFYTKSEYDAYLKGKSNQSTANQSKPVKNTIQSLFKKSSESFSKSVSKAGYKISNAAKQTEQSAQKQVNKVKQQVVKTFNSVSEKGKSFISKKKSLNVAVGGIEDDYRNSSNDYEKSKQNLENNRRYYAKAVKDLGNSFSEYKQKVYNDKNNKLKNTEKLFNAEKAFKKMFNISSKLLVESYRDSVVSTAEKKVRDRQEDNRKALEKYTRKDYFEATEELNGFKKLFNSISNEYSNYLESIKQQRKSKDIPNFNSLKIKYDEMTPEEDMAAINPYYGQDTYDWTHNCSFCTAAYEMRRRGYDVQAASASKVDENGDASGRLWPDDTYPSTVASYYGFETFEHNDGKIISASYEKVVDTGIKGVLGNRKLSLASIEAMYYDEEKIPNWISKSQIENLYKTKVLKNADYVLYYSSKKDTNQYDLMHDGSISHAETTTAESRQKIIKSMEKEGPGARGNLSVRWYSGAGHSIVWEVQSNGEVIFRDCQTNDVYDPQELLSNTVDCDYFRTDDKELSDKILKVVRNKNNNYLNDEHDNETFNKKKK